MQKPAIANKADCCVNNFYLNYCSIVWIDCDHDGVA